jgi:hypothetical protein
VIPKEIIQTIQTRVVKIKTVLWVAGLLLKKPPGNVVIPIVATIINSKKRITLRTVVNLKLEMRPIAEFEFVGKLISVSKYSIPKTVSNMLTIRYGPMYKFMYPPGLRKYNTDKNKIKQKNIILYLI